MNIVDTTLDKLKSSFLILCPWCDKEFRAFKKDIAGEAEPKYICLSCKKSFKLSFFSNKTASFRATSKLRGEPIFSPNLFETDRTKVQMLKEESITKICFKCTKEVPSFLNRCFFCGAQLVKKIPARVSELLLFSLWKRVLSNWEKDHIHTEFMLKCYQQSRVRFGLQCYGEILKQDANNEKAKQMIKMAEKLSFFFEKNPKVKMGAGFLITRRLCEYLSLLSPFIRTYGFDFVLAMLFILMFSWMFISL